MMNKKSLNLNTINRFSVAIDIFTPVILYYAMVNQHIIPAWILMGIVAMARFALVFVTK